MTNTLYDALFGIYKKNQSTFLVCDDGTEVSFASFVERAAQIAHVLAGCGVGADDRVLVQAPKLLDTLALYAGTVQAGAVYLPLNTAYTTSEVSYFAEDAAPKVIVGDTENSDELGAIAQSIGTTFLTLSETGGSLSSAADTKPSHFETAHRNPDDLAGLLYTSGTTGRSKGAMMSHKNMLSNAGTLTELWRITRDDRLIQALPTFYIRLLNDERFNSILTQNMHLVLFGSASLLAETHLELEEMTSHHILERYGMVETNMTICNSYLWENISGTVGYAFPVTASATGSLREVSEAVDARTHASHTH